MTITTTFKGAVQISSRGYFITISQTDSDQYHRLTQAEVNRYEERTGKTGQILADFLASRTKEIQSGYNGKYRDSSISIDMRSDEQIADAKKEEELLEARIEENKKTISGTVEFIIHRKDKRRDDNVRLIIWQGIEYKNFSKLPSDLKEILNEEDKNGNDIYNTYPDNFETFEKEFLINGEKIKLNVSKTIIKL